MISILSGDNLTPERPTVERDEAYVKPEDKPCLDDFTIEQTIGVGNFGKVMLAFNNKTKQHSALKVIAKSKIE